MLHINEGKRHV